jgi:hypothetical protein
MGRPKVELEPKTGTPASSNEVEPHVALRAKLILASASDTTDFAGIKDVRCTRTRGLAI